MTRSDRPDFAAIARRITADLETLSAAVRERSGADNARALRDHAAGAVHRLLDGAGAYEVRR